MQVKHTRCAACGTLTKSYAELAADECAEMIRRRRQRAIVANGSERGSFKGLAAALGVSTTTLWMWETGRRMPPLDAFKRWDATLDDYAHLLPK